tara:strand:+ start:3731 stop:4396 length:666 start_codon:yes stop_codon:yes gene_type:complete
LIDETGFAVVDSAGNVFGQCKSVYFTKTVSLKSAELINSPADAYRRKGENTEKASAADARNIVAISEKGSLIIRDHLCPILSFHSTQPAAIHAAVKLIKQKSPNSWMIKSKRHYGVAFFTPLFAGLFFGLWLFLIWHYAVDLEAGLEVTTTTNFRHRAKAQLSLAIAESIGTSGVKVAAGVLTIFLTAWTIWGVIHVDSTTTFKLKTKIGQRRKRAKLKDI